MTEAVRRGRRVTMAGGDTHPHQVIEVRTGDAVLSAPALMVAEVYCSHATTPPIDCQLPTGPAPIHMLCPAVEQPRQRLSQQKHQSTSHPNAVEVTNSGLQNMSLTEFLQAPGRARRAAEAELFRPTPDDSSDSDLTSLRRRKPSWTSFRNSISV